MGYLNTYYNLSTKPVNDYPEKLVDNEYHLRERYSLQINASGLSSGIYFIQLVSKNESKVTKIAVVK